MEKSEQIKVYSCGGYIGNYQKHQPTAEKEDVLLPTPDTNEASQLGTYSGEIEVLMPTEYNGKGKQS